MNYFNGIKTLDELKATYRRLAIYSTSSSRESNFRILRFDFGSKPQSKARIGSAETVTAVAALLLGNACGIKAFHKYGRLPVFDIVVIPIVSA